MTEKKEIFHQNYESDFYLPFQFENGLPTYPWRLEFRTKGTPVKGEYIVSFDGKKYTRCEPMEGRPGCVMIEFNDHMLGCGRLTYKLREAVPDGFFSDGKRDTTLPVTLDIELYDGPTKGKTPPETIIALERMLRGDSAYETFKRHHPETTLTEAEYSAAPIDAADAANEARAGIEQTEGKIKASELQREQAEQGRVEAESERVAAEQDREQGELSREQAETSRANAERGRVEVEPKRVAAEQGRVQSEQSRERAETSRANAERGRVKAEGERDKRLGESVAKAETAAGKADDAAEAVMQLPIVRTDISQALASEAQTTARENISAVGALPVVLTLAGDNTLSVASALDLLTSHYKLYATRPGAYRWAVVISDASGGQVEEVEADAIPADGVLHLVFRSQVLGQTYDLALTIAADAVSGVSVAPWRRTEQAGANTTAGGFLQNRIDLDKYAGNRGLEVFFRTGSDVSARQHINSNEPLGLLISLNMLYVNLWGLWASGYKVTADTDYHVVVSFEKDKLEASLYVNGEFVSARRREDAAPVYLAYNALGCTNVGNFPFKGTIYHARLFNFAPTAEDVAVFYNNGDPAGYIVPAEMRGGGNSYQSDFAAGPDNWVASGGDTTIIWDSERLTASSPSSQIRIRRTFTRAEAAFRMPHAYAFEVVVDGDPDFSYMTFYSFSAMNNANVFKSAGEIIDGGLRLRGVVSRRKSASFAQECFCYFFNVPIGTVIRIKSIQVTPLDCIAEYLPQNVASGVWYDSAPQLPVNGNLPPLWKSAGGYDLVATGTPEIAYKSARRENMDVLAEVLAESECSLEGRIARLEKALIDLTTGRAFIPKLTVKELEVWGANNLVVTGEGAPSKAPDRAGQIYIDTKNNAQYRSTGNAAVSDWKNA